jgi:hypothetical protein
MGSRVTVLVALGAGKMEDLDLALEICETDTVGLFRSWSGREAQ